MPTLSIQQSEMIINYITFGAAYLISIACAGGTQAWMAKACGDDTPEEAGYLSFNPLVHIHPVGALMFLIFYIGFGPILPINPNNISIRWRKLKLFLVYMSKPCVNIVLATASLVGMLAIFDYATHEQQSLKVHTLIIQAFNKTTIPTQAFFNLYPNIPSIFLVCGMLLLALVYMNTIVATFNFIIHGVYYAGVLMLERSTMYAEYLQYIMLFGPVLVLFFFANAIQETARLIVQASAQIIGWALGLG